MFKKDDKGKPRLDMIPPRALVQVAYCMMGGAERHGDKNYMEQVHDGDIDSRFISAALRHINADCQESGSVAEDTKLSHIAHAVASLMIVLERRSCRK